MSTNSFNVFACADQEQAVLWFLRTNRIDKKGMLNQNAEALTADVRIPGMKKGHYQITAWNTSSCKIESVYEMEYKDEPCLCLTTPPITTDLAFAIRLTGD